MSEPSNEDLLSIINEINENANNFQSPKVIKYRDDIHSQGLLFSLNLCMLTTSNPTHPNTKYLLFSILSSLLHPRTPPEFLSQICDSFIPIAKEETSRLSKLAIYRCVANAFYHLISEDNIDELENLLPSIGDDAVLLICELICVLRCSFDVPMLAQKNFLIFSRVLPALLPTMISYFFNDPDSESYNMLDFCLEKFQEAPLQMLISHVSSDITFSIEEFIQQIILILNSKMPEIVAVFSNPQIQEKQYNSALCYLVQFFSKSVLYGLEASITEEILRYIFNIPFESDNTYCFCQMIKTVYNVHKGLLSNDLVSFLCGIALENAKEYNLENLKIVLGVVSYFLSDLTNPMQENESNIQPQIFAQIVEQILPLLIRQYPDKSGGEIIELRITSINGQEGNGEEANYGNDNNENNNNNEEDEDEGDDGDDELESEKSFRDDIMDFLAYFALEINPGPSLEMIEGIYDNLAQSNQANFYVCEWVLGLLSKFLNLAKDREGNEVEFISPIALRIVTTPLIGQYAQEYSSIEELICDIFTIIENKEIALTAFRLAISQYSDDDSIMEKAIDLANEYKFTLLDEIPVDAPLSPKMLTLLACKSPSPAIEQRINELMETGDTNRMQEAAALIVGLQKAKEEYDIEFDAVKYAIHFSENKMFAEALKISYDDPEICDKIIDMASEITFEDDIFDRICMRALKAAINFSNGYFTEKVLIFINFERNLDSKIIVLILKLFVKHIAKIKEHDETADVTENSLKILLAISKVLIGQSTLFHTTASEIIETLVFFFDRVFPFIDDEFWLSIFNYYLSHDLEVHFYSDYSDLLFYFFMRDFERYRAIFMEALSSATDNAEELFDYLHNEIDRDSSKMKNLFHSRFICVYKAFDYYKFYT